MTPSTVLVRRLSADEAPHRIPELSDVLIDCVNGGASVSFMHPMTDDKATRFWSMVATDLAAGTRALLIAEDEEQRIVGTVQLILGVPENQPHRADVAKMLVHTRARGRGVAQRLMQEVEVTAREEGRTLLVLDTVTGSAADRLYTRAGWHRVGEIPDYALMPDGAFCPTTIFFKSLVNGRQPNDTRDAAQ